MDDDGCDGKISYEKKIKLLCVPLCVCRREKQSEEYEDYSDLKRYFSFPMHIQLFFVVHVNLLLSLEYLSHRDQRENKCIKNRMQE